MADEKDTKTAMPLGMQFKAEAMSTPEPSQTPEETPQVNNYQDLEEYLRKKMESTNHPETDKEREARERREKRTMFLANLRDGLGAFHSAFAQARGETPMNLGSMSERQQARFDKLKADREHDEDRWMNYALNLGKIKDNQRDFDYRNRTLALREREEDRRQALADIAELRLKWQREYQQGRLDIEKEKLDIDRQYKAGKLSNAQKNAALQRLADYEITTTTTHERDAFGHVIGTKKVEKRVVSKPDGTTSVIETTQGGNAVGGTMPGVEEDDDENKMPGVE